MERVLVSIACLSLMLLALPAESEGAESLQNRPEDKAAQVLSERCQTFKKTPPPDSWAGAHVLNEK